MRYTKQELLARIGHPDQLLSCRESRLEQGRAHGVHAVEVANGSGFEATILPDRCMDIYQLRYKGINLNYISPTGVVAPQYYESEGLGWLRSFFVGMLTTCGLQNLGGPGLCNGEEQGLHGRIANTPAQDFRIERGWNGDQPTLTLSGRMQEARLFGENLSLERRFHFVYGQDSLEIEDTIRNDGFTPRAYVYGLHINFGFPLLDEGCSIVLDSESTEPRDENARKTLDQHRAIEAPFAPCAERCYHHKLRADQDGMTGYTVFNEALAIGLKVRYALKDYPYFVQWKMTGKGEYVLGMEPMNSFIDAPKPGEADSTAPVLKPGEEHVYRIRLEGVDQLERCLG